MLAVTDDHDYQLSVIVPTYRREAVLCDTLASIFEQRGVRYEVIVVDQTPVHEGATMDYLKGCAERENVLIIKETYANLPHARNVGICASRAPLILFLDDDVLLPSGVLARYVKAMDNPKVDAVGGATLRRGESYEDLLPLPVSERAARNRLDLPLMRYRGVVPGALHLAGGNMSMRREWLLRANGFDHSIRGGSLGEDTEFFARIRRLSAHTLYDSACAVVHLQASAGGTRADALSLYLRHRERMCNFYYMMFHGAGVRLALVMVARRWKNRISPPRYREPAHVGPGPAREGGSGFFASVLGRSAGAMDGIVAAWKERRKCGDLDVAAERLERKFSGESLPTVSVIIATYNRPESLLRAVKSLLAQREDLVEIIIVDQSPIPQTNLPDDEKIRVLRTSTPNASRARNAGAREARGSVLLFIDDDAEALPDLILQHAAAIRSPGVGCVGGLVILDSKPGVAGTQYPLPHWTAREHMESPVCYHATPFPDALHIITCNLSVRRDAFIRVDGFWERFAGYGEDIDLVARLRRTGLRAVYEPNAAVAHIQCASGGTRAGRGSFGWYYRRAIAHHLSELRVAGYFGWPAAELRRQRRRIGRRFIKSKGSGSGVRSRWKPLCELLAIPHAWFLRIAFGNSRGSYASTAEKFRDGR
ncbi:hypothetical protein BH09SUM1_BH09SUM1_34040 [soil metagenome]